MALRGVSPVALPCCCCSIATGASERARGRATKRAGPVPSLEGGGRGAYSVASIKFGGGFSPLQLHLKIGIARRRTGAEGVLRFSPAQIMATLEKTEDSDANKKIENYSETMQQATGTGLCYRHELGMNYAHVLPDLIVGSCLQTPADVDHLKEAGVGTIFCLQQDPDLVYFSVDIGAIEERARYLQSIEHVRAGIRDFDPFDLRLRLPAVVATLYKKRQKNEGKTYIHCTAGLGRAPAVALTYMYWIGGYQLSEANSMLQRVRRCHPKLESIKAATADMLISHPKKRVLLSWKDGAPCSVEIAGLDVGWFKSIALQQGNDGHWYVEREIPAGTYEFKFIVDGSWTVNHEYPVTQPNRDGHVNNWLKLPSDAADDELKEFRKQIMSDDFVLTEEHRRTIREKLESLAEL